MTFWLRLLLTELRKVSDKIKNSYTTFTYYRLYLPSFRRRPKDQRINCHKGCDLGVFRDKLFPLSMLENRFIKESKSDGRKKDFVDSRLHKY